MKRTKYTPYIVAFIVFAFATILAIVIERSWYSSFIRYTIDVLVILITIMTFFLVRARSRNSSE